MSFGQKIKIWRPIFNYKFECLTQFSGEPYALKKIVKIKIICIGLVHNISKNDQNWRKKSCSCVCVRVPGENRSDNPLIFRRKREFSGKVLLKVTNNLATMRGQKYF